MLRLMRDVYFTTVLRRRVYYYVTQLNHYLYTTITILTYIYNKINNIVCVINIYVKLESLVYDETYFCLFVS